MKARRNLLIDEYPLIVLPSLAKVFGLNEAIVIQQVHYWLQNPKGSLEIDGVRWVYNTYENWQEDNFSFWSVRTVIRIFTSLEVMDILVSMQQASYDRKKYYRVHYDNLASWIETDCHNADLQDGTMDDDNLASSTLTETTEETTKEITEENDDDALAKATLSYQVEIGVITAFIADEIKDAIDTYPLKWILDAMHEAAVQNKRSWKYCLAILKRWKAQGNQDPAKPVQSVKPNGKANKRTQPTDNSVARKVAANVFGTR